MKRVICAFAVLLSLIQPARSGYEEAAAAYKRGDYAVALRQLLPLAGQGVEKAQLILGHMYLYGRGVPKDQAQAARWYRRAAEQGYAHAQFSLALLFATGDGVSRNYIESQKWLNLAIPRLSDDEIRRNAIRLRNAVGGRLTPTQQSEAARLAQDWKPKSPVRSESRNAGQGSPDHWARTPRPVTSESGTAGHGADVGFEAFDRGDYAAALRVFVPLAERGDALSQFGLGIMYFAGWGVARNDRESVRWLRRSAEQGNPIAQKYLGFMYRSGHGVRRSHMRAYKWLYLAVSRLPPGEERDKTVKARDEISAKLTPTERTDAEWEARNWRPTKETALPPQIASRRPASRPAPPPIVTGSEAGVRQPAASRTAASPSEIARVQRDLVALGFNPGPADGAMGPKTRRAIAAFQQSQGMDVTGEPSEALVAALRGAASARATVKNRDGIAVIIGNKAYKGRTPPVEFAHNDADAMKRFVIGRLGYRPGNVIDLRDASKGEFENVFGTRDTHQGKLADWVKAGRSDVMVFYSGHGVPDLEDRRGYLLPVDGNPNRARITGYSVDLLYANLAKIGARSVTVYLDACFSGDSPKGMLVRAASGLSVTPRKADATPGVVVLTAASGDQFASWDEDAKHGLFTLHLLKALRGAADTDRYGKRDGKVTLGEVRKYLDDEMTYQARRRYGRAQTVSVQGEASQVLTTHAASQKR